MTEQPDTHAPDPAMLAKAETLTEALPYLLAKHSSSNMAAMQWVIPRSQEILQKMWFC